MLVRIDESCPDPEDDRRRGPGGDARGVSRSRRIAGDGDAWRARRDRSRRRVFLARRGQRGRDPLLPHPASDGARFRPVVGPRARRHARRSFAACSGRWKRWRIESRSRSQPVTRATQPDVAIDAAAPLSIKKCRDPIEQLFAALVDDVGVACVGDFDPVRRRGEGVGKTRASSIETTVSLVPWRINVGQVTARAESMGRGA